MPRPKPLPQKSTRRTQKRSATIQNATSLQKSEQKKRILELREARFQLKTLLEVHGAIYYLVYPKHPEKNYFSPNWKKLLGFSPDPIIDPLEKKKNSVLIDSLRIYESNIEQLTQKKKVNFKYEYQHPKSGKIFWLQEEITLKTDPLSGQEIWVGRIIDISEPEFFKKYIGESEKRFKSITDSLPVMIWVTDEEDNVTYFNQKSYTFFDIKKGQALRLADFGPIIDPIDKERVFAQWDRQKEKRLPLHFEVLITDRHDQKRYLAIEAIPRILPQDVFIGYIGAAFDLTKEYQFKQGMEKAFGLLQASEEKYRKLFENMQLTKLQAEEEERIQIGRDLHDGVGQVLAYLSMRLGLAKLRNDANQEEWAQLEQSARSALEQVRLLSRTLAPPALRDLGLRDAVKELIASYDIIEKPKIELEIYRQTEDYNLSLEKKIVVYRILQELLSNAFKHAHATTIRIKLSFTKRHFELVFTEDGIGFDPSKVKKGVGLESIRSRVAFYKGTITHEQSPGKKNKTLIQLPIP